MPSPPWRPAGQVTALAGAGWPAARLDLTTVRSGRGLRSQAWTGSPHVGKIAELP